MSLLLVAAPFHGKGLVQLRWSDNDQKIVNFSVMTRWPLGTPMDPAHTTGGRRHVGGVLGEGQVSLVRRLCPHMSRGGTSVDESGGLIMMASFFGGLWRIFYLGDCTNRDSSFVVACTSDTPMPLRCQRHEVVVITSRILCHGGRFQ